MSRMQRIVGSLMDHFDEHEAKYKYLVIPLLKTFILLAALGGLVAFFISIIRWASEAYL